MHRGFKAAEFGAFSRKPPRTMHISYSNFCPPEKAQRWQFGDIIGGLEFRV